jgi:hypothetical protein
MRDDLVAPVLGHELQQHHHPLDSGHQVHRPARARVCNGRRRLGALKRDPCNGPGIFCSGVTFNKASSSIPRPRRQELGRGWEAGHDEVAPGQTLGRPTARPDCSCARGKVGAPRRARTRPDGTIQARTCARTGRHVDGEAVPLVRVTRRSAHYLPNTASCCRSTPPTACATRPATSRVHPRSSTGSRRTATQGELPEPIAVCVSPPKSGIDPEACDHPYERGRHERCQNMG